MVFNVCIIYIVLLVLYLIYYFNVIVEQPTIYHSQKMEKVYADIPSINQNIYWTIGCHNNLIQYFIYRIESKIDKYIGKQFYKTNIIITPDNEKLIMGIGNINYKFDGILLIFHTIFGTYCDGACSVKKICKELNLLPISYSRRGHGIKLNNLTFNTVGHMEDLELILDYIESEYPNKPIYGLARSAGTNLLSRYLGNTKHKSRISLAILISPGFDFNKSLTSMNEKFSKILVNKCKDFWLKPNKELFTKNKKDLKYYNLLLNASNLQEWHNYQWYFTRTTKNKKEYNNIYNPIHVLKKIKIPILYINAMDDFLFNKTVVSSYKNLVNESDYKIIIHTNGGSHLGFYEDLFNDWSFKISKEFIISVKKNIIN